MARIMSFITTIFIIVPMIAPLLGQIILNLFNWEAIFYFQILFITFTIIWFNFRQHETLPKDKRINFSKNIFANGLKEYFKYKGPIVFTIITGFLNGAFFTYLGASQQIFQGQYQLVEEFPYIFGGIAFSFGVAALLNASLVIKLGMMKLVKTSIYFFLGISFLYIILFSYGTNPPVEVLIAFLAIQFLSMGFISGNLSALAMQPIGHIAGIGAAIFSFISMTMGVLISIVIGSQIENTGLPLFVGFFSSGLVTLFLLRYLHVKENKGKEKRMEI